MKEDLIAIGLKQESILSRQDLIHILPNLWKKQGHNLQVRTWWRIILLEQGTSPCGWGQEWVSISVKSSPHFWAWGDPSPYMERFWKTSSRSFPLLVAGQRKEMRIKPQYFVFTYKTIYNEIYKSTWFVFDASFIVCLALPFCYSGSWHFDCLPLLFIRRSCRLALRDYWWDRGSWWWFVHFRRHSRLEFSISVPEN